MHVVDNGCAKYNVRYYLTYGTELGAVREKGFIKWDDDVDIKVLREDYPRFREAMLKELNGDIRFIEPEDLSPYFFDFIPRIINTKYNLNEEDKWGNAFHGFTNNPAIDVFLIDTISEKTLRRKIKIFRLKYLHVLGMTKRPKAKGASPSLAQRIILALMGIPGHFLTIEKITKKYNKVAASGASSGKRFASNCLFLDPVTYDADIFVEEVRCDFEDGKFPVPKLFDKELRTTYGDDYMIPRKPNDREMVHFEEK
jgi:lipopolysaccharide cholinephosphotransferase